jgi:lactonase
MKRHFIEIKLLSGIFRLASTSVGLGKSGIKKNEVPIPPDLVNLPTIKAEPWLQVDSDLQVMLEGPAFDRNGNLYLTSFLDGRIFKVDLQKKVSLIFQNRNIWPTGCAFHKDGRLFVACITGELLSMNPDGSNINFITPRYQGKPQSINDLVFDSKGNLYVSGFTGNISNPTGGVYRFSSDFTRVDPILENLASANGISLSPEGNVLWVTESCRNTLLRVELLADGITVNPMAGAMYVYYSMGGPGGLDSNKVDKEGNIYQCLIFQGRAIIFNSYGIPIANVVIPGREEGKYLVTTNLAFSPGTSEAYMTAAGKGGAWLYTFQGLAEGLPLFSHQ